MRCYDGCPDSELKDFLANNKRALTQVKKLNPDAYCTYHHPTGYTEDGHQVHVCGKPISRYHNTLIAACGEAVEVLSASITNQGLSQRSLS